MFSSVITANKRYPLYSVIALYLLIGVAFFSYLPGINGFFIFDDMPNLSTMGQYQNLSGWDNFWLFLLEGDSGPTGRPISLASFYLNDHSWPSSAKGFIFTNILIHLLNGILVYWFIYKLSHFLNFSQSRQITFSLMATALWLLHPFNTTTVLYVIQRMTELSTLFMLAGLTFYIHGREKIISSPFAGYITLTLGIGISLILAIFSKENGILLVAYIFVLEWFLIRPSGHTPPRNFNLWFIPFIILPVAFIFLYLVYQGVWAGSFAGRRFTMLERVLSEARILFDYLRHILLPFNQGTGLFHDDYIISRGLFTPWSTFPAALGIIFLVAIVPFLRKKLPIIAFAISWFFAGHILESTTLPLELYFEHRNYLAMLGILIAVAYLTTGVDNKRKTWTAAFAVALIAFYSFLTLQNAQLWGNPKMLSATWYSYHPNSVRAQEAYHYLVEPLNDKNTTQAQKNQQKNSAYTALWKLKEACEAKEISAIHLSNTLHSLSELHIHRASVNALIGFLDIWDTGSCNTLTQKQVNQFLVNIIALKNVQKQSNLLRQAHLTLADFAYKNKNLSKTITNLEKAYKIKPEVSILLLQASYLASAGLNEQALEMLNDTSALEKTYKKKLILRIKQKEIDTLKHAITTKISSIDNQD